ncbi:MAG: phosphoribosylamine--glycine ligase [Planctomycetes bacterium]|nr:phosphoribosylamine--glycine ligase [Planctomycetota bacterium]
MQVLVIGGGGREHALCWKIAASPLVKKVWCAPGNPGIASVATCVDIAADDIERLLAFAKREEIELTVVGPEGPLVAGIVDRFEAAGLKIFGPSKAAAEIEGNKVFCKDLLFRYRIPTANFRAFESSSAALGYVEGLREFPVVIKAAGLASGKGVRICKDVVAARAAVRECMEERAFGKAGERIVIEDFLHGEELSVLAITDGETIVLLEAAQDHKAVNDGDQGPNTGGMGAFSPVPGVGVRLLRQIESTVLVPTIHALNREGRRFRGVLYAGLMITEQGPRVLEFNARFGDPETQPLLMRLKSDLVPFLLYAAGGELSKIEGITWRTDTAVCVVATAAGYPGAFEKGRTIRGLDFLQRDEQLEVFHSGTARAGNDWITAGGRVFSVCALGADKAAAQRKAYDALERLSFEGMHYRRDIGNRRPVS